MNLSDSELELLESDEFKSLVSADWSELLQNNLENECAFIRFARSKKIAVAGVVTGDPSKFFEQGLLKADRYSQHSPPHFHPFRIYTLDKLQQFKNEPSDWLKEQSSIWNYVIDLAIMLEPIYWPQITNITKLTYSNESTRFDTVNIFREKALNFLKKLDVTQWEKVHQSIKFDAEKKDDNSNLYLLLRQTRWEERRKLNGSVSAALWYRHIAEVLRRGFEEAYKVEWREEDYVSGQWSPGARTIAYGSERPLDNPYLTKQYLSQRYGIISGSAVRWYVEGPTEYHAIMELLTTPAQFNIEIVDLMGNLKTEKQNIALKLNDCLRTDIDQRRFSFISFDMDVPENVKTIKQQVVQGNVCGYVGAHYPDFEFANFNIDELVKVAVDFDESRGFDSKGLIEADWSEVTSGKEFEKKYTSVSDTRKSLKGAEWGRALARFALDNPELNGKRRPFMEQIEAACKAVRVKYEFQKTRYQIDPDTFKIKAIDRSKLD